MPFSTYLSNTLLTFVSYINVTIFWVERDGKVELKGCQKSRLFDTFNKILNERRYWHLLNSTLHIIYRVCGMRMSIQYDA